MDALGLDSSFRALKDAMAANRDYLVGLDQKAGDGDLGISMAAGYAAASCAMSARVVAGEKDLGRLLMLASASFNEAAPSTLGTITSLALMGMARFLKGRTEAGPGDFAAALLAGVGIVMEKAGSKPGEKTILDSVIPAAQALQFQGSESCAEALARAAGAAASGCEATASMVAVHGRAAYYGEKGLGTVDAGAVAGRIIFETLAAWAAP